MDRPPRLLRAARIAVVVQALALLVVIGLTIPSFMDYLFHPFNCTPDQWCMDFRGFIFEASALFLGPLALSLIAACWLWRRPRRWPAAIPLVVDAVVIVGVLNDLVDYAKIGSAEPNIVVQVLLGFIPAVVSLILVLALLRQQLRPTTDDR